MMLLGIYLHIACGYTPLPDVWWFKDPHTTNLFDPTLLFIHEFRMPMFFVLAGFFAAMIVEKRGLRPFLKNRAVRVLLPLIVGTLTLYPLLLWMNHPLAFTSTRWIGDINPTHLWFLLYLVVFYVVAAICWQALPRLEWIARSRFRLLWIILPTIVAFASMEHGLLDTPHSFIPVPRIAFAYGIFFFFGWLLWSSRDVITATSRRCWLYLVSGIAVSCGHIYFVLIGNRYGAAIAGAVGVWLIIFGLLGIFERYFDRENKTMRYIADSSYWQYLIHPPVVVYFQQQLANSPIHPALKVLVVLACTIPVLLGTYALFVRHSWIGRILNGPQRRPLAATV